VAGGSEEYVLCPGCGCTFENDMSGAGGKEQIRG